MKKLDAAVFASALSLANLECGRTDQNSQKNVHENPVIGNADYAPHLIPSDKAGELSLALRTRIKTMSPQELTIEKIDLQGNKHLMGMATENGQEFLELSITSQKGDVKYFVDDGLDAKLDEYGQFSLQCENPLFKIVGSPDDAYELMVGMQCDQGFSQSPANSIDRRYNDEYRAQIAYTLFELSMGLGGWKEKKWEN